MADDTLHLRPAAAAATPGVDRFASLQERAETAYDLAALLNALDARIGVQITGAETLDAGSLQEVSRVVRIAARTALGLGNELLEGAFASEAACAAGLAEAPPA